LEGALPPTDVDVVVAETQVAADPTAEEDAVADATKYVLRR
jgi:hypothetical protein